MSIDRSKYSEYDLSTTGISGNIDSDFDFFFTPTRPSVDEPDPVLIETEFISNVELAGDYHDQFLTTDIDVAFVSQDIEHTLIPNFETLEVMLVERGLTYDAIRVQTNIDEFIFDDLAALDDRSAEYNSIIRYQSGYRPSAPFVRDPADYFNGNNYDEQVYQKQTLLEKLRAQFEGNMIILNDFNRNEVGSLKMMIYGEWRPIAFQTIRDDGTSTSFPEIRTLEYYHYINNLNLDFNAAADWFDDRSILNVMIDEEVITNLQDDGLSSTIWNDFEHYDYDEGGRVGIENTDYLQVGRYEQYINITNDDVFSLEYMQPYEPEGSELYYEEYGGWNSILDNTGELPDPNLPSDIVRVNTSRSSRGR